MRRSRRLWPRLVALCASCILVPAMATLALARQGGGVQGVAGVGRPMVFDRLDADQDGSLSLEEFRSNRAGNGAGKGAARNTSRPKATTK